jgi:hypothetical protein
VTVLLVAAALAQTLDLAQITSDPDLPRRAVRALDYASQQLDRARKASAAGEVEPMKTALERVAVGAETALEALKSGKRNTSAWKKAGQRCRDLTRRLDTFERDLPIEERPAGEAIRKRVQAVQEELLAMTLGRKPK